MRELVLSWNLKDAVEFAKTEEGLKALSALLADRNPRVRLRALSVLSSVIDEWESGRGRLIGLFFEPLINLLTPENEKTCLRALSVLRRLLEGVHIQLREFETLVSSMFSLTEECDRMAWNEVVELLKVTSVVVVASTPASIARDRLQSENLRTAILASYLLVREGDPLEGISEEFLYILKRAIRSGDLTTVELALMTIKELLRTPLAYPVDTVLLGLVPSLRRLAEEGENVSVRQEAKNVLGALMDALRNYYQKNPWDLEKSVKHLVRGNRREDAILIASLMGDISILLAVESSSNFAEGGIGEFGTMGGREL